MNSPLKPGIPGSTRGTTMLPILEAIDVGTLEARVEVVLSNRKEAPILEKALNAGIPARFVSAKDRARQDTEREISDILRQHGVELLLLIGYMRILSPEFVQEWAMRILNVHPSLLPAFSGGMDKQVHAAVIASGAKETGCTIHYVTEEVDVGPILIQKRCALRPNEVPENLKARVQALEGPAYIEAIRKFRTGLVQRSPI